MRSEPVAPQIGEDVEFEALGQKWKLGRLDVDVWDALLEWARPRIISPLEHLRTIIKDLAPDVAMLAIREAMNACPTVLTVFHPAFQYAINESAEGMLQQFWLQLKKYHPDVTRDQAFAVMNELGERQEYEATKLKTSGVLKPSQAKSQQDNGTASADELAVDSEFSTEGVSLTAVGDRQIDAR